ncbi:HNH endonuclease signature motif containing protein [Nocardioides pelophilus]|uniref:HNH endonuclease signature motif containing protein n=1 Tax=Nocardioides pelophilus TaxID=2172019 RepID=UPI0016024193|nr:HNH endonuclease signature motif containing protein [Nocardioides pelophilus]
MDLGTAPLFDLTAPVADEAVDAAELSRSQQLLAEIGDRRAIIVEQEIATVRAIAEWAAEHVVTDQSNASTLTERGLDTGLPVAGPGAPLISDFAVMELSALLGRTLDSGRSYVGQVVELAHRLPKTWIRVLDGQVPVWKALRIADTTRILPEDAARFVDAHLAPFAHGCTWAQIDRLVEEALVRFDPASAEEKRREAQDHRHFDIGLDQAGFDGTAHISGTLDIVDALDLEQAIARRATVLGQLGCDESLDVRRSIAAGELAREDLSLDLEVVDPETGEITRTVPGRKAELILHLNAAHSAATADSAVARCANTRTPLAPEQIKTWLGTPGTSVIVRPVIDLNGHQPVDSYEIPDRIRRQVTLRDHHCVFPHCTRPAESCDLDHIVPHDEDGPTCQCNLAPTCRGHHRMKTAGRAHYRILTPGTYLWTLPSGTYLVDPTGTHNLTTRGSDPPDQ